MSEIYILTFSIVIDPKYSGSYVHQTNFYDPKPLGERQLEVSLS